MIKSDLKQLNRKNFLKIQERVSETYNLLQHVQVQALENPTPSYFPSREGIASKMTIFVWHWREFLSTEVTDQLAYWRRPEHHLLSSHVSRSLGRSWKNSLRTFVLSRIKWWRRKVIENPNTKRCSSPCLHLEKLIMDSPIWTKVRSTQQINDTRHAGDSIFLSGWKKRKFSSSLCY